MRLEQLRYIIEIADTGSFTLASERLFIAQPSISQAVSSLEKELNIQIFQRSRSGAVPTEVGKQVIDRARNALIQLQEVEKICKTDFAGIRDTITISAIPTLSALILPKVVSAYKKIFPNVTIHIREHGSETVRADVVSGEAEVGLISLHQPDTISEKELDFQNLITGHPIAYVGINSPLADCHNSTYGELIRYPVILFGKGYHLSRYVLERLSKYGEPRILSCSRSPETIKKFVIETDAVAFGPDISLFQDPYVEKGLIQLLALDDDHTIRFGTITNTRRPMQYATEMLLKEIVIQADHINRMLLKRQPK